MQKRTIIKRINTIIKEFGSFGSGEVETNGETYSPCVGELGNYVGLAEYFEQGKATINIYDPSSFSSDPMDEYDMDYVDMSKDILNEILLVAENWEADQIQTEKRISN